MARVIEFYVPQNFTATKQHVISEPRGKLLKFPLLMQQKTPQTESHISKLKALLGDVPLLRQIPML
jgi:hypothetical protein